MNRLFSALSVTVTAAAVVLLTVPFLFVLHEGLPFLVSPPYSAELQHALYLSLYSAVISSVLCLVFTLLITWTRYRSKKYIRTLLDYIFLFPLGVPHLVSGIALITFFGANRFGKVLQPLGIDFVYTPAGVVMAQFFVNLPYAVKNFSASFEMIDPNYVFIEKNLGLSNAQIFFHIIMPSLKNQILCIWMICFARALGEFGACMMLVGITSMKTETLATAIFLNMTTGDFEAAAGISIMLMLVSIAALSLTAVFMKKTEQVGYHAGC
ncbi:MAG: ABC transporter permease [Treponema sp.]